MTTGMVLKTLILILTSHYITQKFNDDKLYLYLGSQLQKSVMKMTGLCIDKL